jgi:hypothetical protein
MWYFRLHTYLYVTLWLGVMLILNPLWAQKTPSVSALGYLDISTLTALLVYCQITSESFVTSTPSQITFFPIISNKLHCTCLYPCSTSSPWSIKNLPGCGCFKFSCNYWLKKGSFFTPDKDALLLCYFISRNRNGLQMFKFSFGLWGRREGAVHICCKLDLLLDRISKLLSSTNEL